MQGRAHDWVAGELWAMPVEAFRGVLAVVDRMELTAEMVEALHASEPAAVSTANGEPLQNTKRATVRDGVACIPIRGVITRYAGLFSSLSGATSVDVVARDFRTAADDPRVRSILLDVNSPGGNVDGIAELAGIIREARGTKPIVSYVGNQAASASYWLASAADRVVLGKTGFVGSIGVISTIDTSEDPDSEEVISTQSPHKRVDVKTKEGRSRHQARVDEMADVFVADVARNRGVSRATVLADFGKGDCLMGKKAVAAGMADQIGTYEHTLKTLSDGVLPPKSPAKSKSTSGKSEASTRGQVMTFQEKLAAFTALFGGGKGDEAIGDEAEETATEPTMPPAKAIHRPRLAAHTAHAPMPTEAEIRERVKAEMEAEFAAKVRTDFAAVARRDAASFLAAEVKAERVLPADTGKLTALFVDFALADHDNPIKAQVNGQDVTYSRLGHFKDELAARGKNGHTTEVIGSDPEESAANLAKTGRKPLANDPTPDEQADAKRRVAAMLAAVPGEHNAAK